MEGIKRTPQSDGDRGWLPGTASCTRFVDLASLFIFAVLKGTTKNFSWPPSESLLLTQAKAETWLSLLVSVTDTDSGLLAQLYRTGLLVYP